MQSPSSEEIHAADSDRDERVRRVVGWALRILLAMTFIAAGGTKLLSLRAMVEEFRQLGFGQWFRYFTGSLEVLGAMSLLSPRWHRLAALLLVCIMAGAIVANVTVLHRPPVLPGALLALAAAVFWLRVIRRAWAWGYGVGSVFVGVLRFIPISSVPNLRSPEYVHGAVHVLTGALFLVAAARASESHLRRYESALGFFYIAFAGIGLCGIVKYEDTPIHVVIGIVSIVLAGREGARGAWNWLRCLRPDEEALNT